MIHAIAETLRRGGIFKFQIGPKTEPVEITSITFFGNKEIVFHPKACACPCHEGKGIIMHDQPCCEPLREVT
jgi:hypothetical protein